jgi:hypothetical protein
METPMSKSLARVIARATGAVTADFCAWSSLCEFL